MVPARREGTISSASGQKVLAETFAKEARPDILLWSILLSPRIFRLQAKWQSEAELRNFSQGHSNIMTDNPYESALSISAPTLTEDSAPVPTPQVQTLRLIREVEVPYTQIEKVPVQTKKIVTVQVDKKVLSKKTITDMRGIREVEGFSIVKVPEQKEIVVEEIQERVIQGVKRLEVEELQDFLWEPVPKGAYVVNARPLPTHHSDANMFGRPYTPRETPIRATKPIYLSSCSLPTSRPSTQSTPNLLAAGTSLSKYVVVVTCAMFDEIFVCITSKQ